MASIDVLVDRAIGTVDRRIFGGFIEHLGRCVYGGVFDEGSPLADDRGFRTDVLAAVRDLAPPQVRWPGGNFVSGYHWADGIGPVSQRPRRAELAWHTEPYGVRCWGLGNEMYGHWQLGQRTAEDYVATARAWGRALKRLDPDLSLISCGQFGINDWDQIVIDGLAPLIDFHSIHLYTGSDDYWSNVLAPHYAERMLDMTRALIDRARYRQRINREIGRRCLHQIRHARSC